MSIDTEETTEAGAARTAGAEAGAAFGSVFAAGAELVRALRRVTTALTALVASEVRVSLASAAVVFLCSVALVAFAVSLWACAVALIGWAFMKATGSVGIALGLLVVLHLILVTASWLAIKRAIQHASFPGTRSELRALGNELRGHVERFQHASAPDRETPP